MTILYSGEAQKLATDLLIAGLQNGTIKLLGNQPSGNKENAEKDALYLSSLFLGLTKALSKEST